MKEQSPLQKVCMQYGKDCFAMGNTWTLSRFLRANGQHDVANNVEIALMRAKSIARANYFARRKELQPDWKDWDAQMAEAMAEDDGVHRW
jgi:hypothetical protein